MNASRNDYLTCFIRAAMYKVKYSCLSLTLFQRGLRIEIMSIKGII